MIEGGFVKLWQDSERDFQLEKLRGRSLKVLWWLMDVAGWNNEVPGSSEMAERMGISSPNVSRAYRELKQAELLQKKAGVYSLNPYFCWKGNDEQYEEACRRVGRGRVVKQIVDRA